MRRDGDKVGTGADAGQKHYAADGGELGNVGHISAIAFEKTMMGGLTLARPKWAKPAQ
ncbi:hypothetical protein BVI2075_270059 [Burkholderia vietnamiensis]|nr:hypothetical protein BVI2075_270059 [Burkholderia vietnamiensis]